VDRLRAARSRFRPRRVVPDADDGAAGSLEEVLAELLLLREENARLKASAHEVPSLGRLLVQARALPAAALGREDAGDEAAQMLLDGLVLRESLLAVCHEIERAMAAVKVRLVELDGNAPPDGGGLLRPVSQGPRADPGQALDERGVDGPGDV
jgi:hypothetical protein